VLMFKLADEHPLTKAGLRCIHVVEKAELGLRPGDIVFEFPLGHIFDTGMACRRDGIIPPEIDIMTIQKEANATRADCNQSSGRETHKRFTVQAGGLGSNLRSPTDPLPYSGDQVYLV
jgi:hypothetical protein